MYLLQEHLYLIAHHDKNNLLYIIILYRKDSLVMLTVTKNDNGDGMSKVTYKVEYKV